MDHQRVAELFEQAIEIPPENLAHWLVQNCGDDAALRARLECLLRADAKAALFMETPPTRVATAMASASTASAEIPGVFGVYRVLRSIGIGGMGEVWLAERSDGEFEQRVAIKQLAYPTPGLLQRFRQERQILARLEHPNIARLIDGGLDANGAPYLVMEYVDGMPITAYVRELALDLRARLGLFLSVCEAVRYAHQNLIVHRDLKPSNIFVSSDGMPKLLDFGIAKVLATTDEVAATQTAAHLLTPDYAAPEQFSGGAITTATDVYALGAVLYELLANSKPARAAISAAMIADHGRHTVPPSAAIDPASGNAGARRRALRGDLDRIVLTALAAEPQRRYSSVEALANDIRQYLDGRPITARGDNAWYRFRKFARRNRYALTAAVFVLAVCVAATVVSLHQARLARDEAQRAGAVRQFLIGVFEHANPDENKGQPISAHQLLEKSEQQIQQRFNNLPALEADVAALLRQLYRDLGDHTHGEVLLRNALALTDKTQVPDDVRARVLVNLAALESETLAKYDDSLQHAQQSLAMLESAPDRNAQDIAKAHWVMAWALINLDRDAAAILLLRATIPQDTAALGQRSEPVAEEWVKLGRALGNTARIDESEVAFGKAMAMASDIYGANSNHLAHVLNEFAQVYYAANDFARAESMQRKALQIHLDLLGPDHPDTLTVRHNLLGTIELSGHFAQALPERLQLLERMKASNDTNPLDMAYQYDAVSNDYRELNRLDEARAMSERALSLIAESQGPQSRRKVTALYHLGWILLLQGHYADADTTLREALTTLGEAAYTSGVACGLRQKLGMNLSLQHRYAEAIVQLQALTTDACMLSLKENDNWRPQVLANLSEALLDSGDIAQANTVAESAMFYARKAFPHQHYRLGIPLFALARVKLAQQHADDAAALLREALAVRSPPHPADDLRVIEIKVALADALAMLGQADEAQALVAEIEPLLKASASPYAADLRARLAAR